MAKSKDPAFLFYSSDFLTGTMFMTNEQTGIYIKLLCSQHQHGGIIDKVSFNAMIGDNEIIKSKFVESELGFYNIRLMEVMEQRNKKSNNISEAVKNIWEKRKNGIPLNFDAIPIESIKNSKKNNRKNNGIAMGTVNVNEIINYFIENGFREDVAIRAFNYYNEANWYDASGKKVLNWKQKMQSVWFKPENKIIEKNKVKEYF